MSPDVKTEHRSGFVQCFPQRQQYEGSKKPLRTAAGRILSPVFFSFLLHPSLDLLFLVCFHSLIYIFLLEFKCGLPRWLSGKESTCQCRRFSGFDPWDGKITWRRKWQPTPVFLPEKSHGQRSLMGSPWGCKRVRRLSNSTTINSSVTYNEVHRPECYLIMASDTWVHVSWKDVTMTPVEVGPAQQPACSLWGSSPRTPPVLTSSSLERFCCCSTFMYVES